MRKLDVQKQAVEFLRRQGFTHIVAHAGSDGPGQLGFRLANDAPDWGLEVVGNLDTVYVFRVPVNASGGS